MLRVVIVSALLVAALGMPIVEDGDLFGMWKIQHGKRYTSFEEETLRKAIFASNVEKAKLLNSLNDGAEYGLTKFADMTEDEFRSTMLGFRADLHPKNVSMATPLPVKDTPTEWDWVAKGAVTPVKNQGMCGSCWAFSTTGDVEGVWFIAGHGLVPLSEEQLVSCDTVDQGCNGGLPSQAFQYIIQAGGLESESAYPYTGSAGSCSADKSKEIAKISSWEQVSSDEDQIAAYLVQNGPLSIGINAANLQLYLGGISNPLFCNPKNLDHGVLIVGFGEENGKKFWKVKNSWGASWGEQGYFRIIRGKGKCGLNTMVTHSKV